MGRRGAVVAAVAAVAVVGVVAGVPGATARASQPTLTVAQYRDRLEAAQALATRFASDPSAAAMDRVRDALALPVRMRVAGAVVTVDRDPFLDALAGTTARDFRAAATHFRALARAAAAAAARPPPDEGAVRAAVSRALSGIATSRSLADRIRDAISRAVASLTDGLRHFRGVATLVAWLVVLAILGGAALLVRTFGLRMAPDLTARTGRPVRRSAVDWRRAAEEARAGGDLREVVRCLYHALVSTLAARGLVRDDPSLTTGETRTAVASTAPALYPAVADAAGVFDRVAYGLSWPGTDEVARMEEADRTVAGTIGRGESSR